jgi:hypothetical protein
LKQGSHVRLERARAAGRRGMEDFNLFTQWEREMQQPANQNFDEFAADMGFTLTSREIKNMMDSRSPKDIPTQAVIELALIYRMGCGVFMDDSALGSSLRILQDLDERGDIKVYNSSARLAVYADKYEKLKEKDRAYLSRQEGGFSPPDHPNKHQLLRNFFHLNQRQFEAFFNRWMSTVSRWKL